MSDIARGARYTNAQGGERGDRYLTVDCHPDSVTDTLNALARVGWLYKAALSNLQEGLKYGWLRLVLEREQR